MPTDAQKKATKRYKEKTYEYIQVMVRKDQGIKAEAMRKASLRGMSLASYLSYLIRQDKPENSIDGLQSKKTS